jgi:prepilin-type N-terminal cleavage/methylation domain-containing protein
VKARGTASEAGFSMIEVVISLLIIAVVTTGSLSFFLNNLRSVNGQTQRQQAVNLANQQLETVQSVPVAKLVNGRTSAAVTSLFATSAATRLKISSQDDTGSSADYDSSATGSSTPTVPTVTTQTVSKIVYSVYTFIDTCWYATSTGLCGPSSGTGKTQEYRASVDVSWQSNGQCVNGCDYSVSTLIDPTSNPQFNSNISTPSGSYFSVGSNSTPGLNPSVINDNGGTCTVNGNSYTGTKIVVTGSGFKAGMRVWISSGGGTIPAASVYQPAASEVDFCLASADDPGAYTISVINTDGGHFQLPITEIPSISDVSGWNPTTRRVTLTGTGFQPGVVFTATAGAAWTGTSGLLTNQASADSVTLTGFSGPVDGAKPVITATNLDGSAATYTITAPDEVSTNPTSIFVNTTTSVNVTGTGFQSGMTAVLTNGNGTASVTSVSSSTLATLSVTATTVGSQTLYLYNDDGGVTTSFTITVTRSSPTVTGASTYSVPAGVASTVTVYGTGFQSGMTATTSNGTATITSVAANGQSLTLVVNPTSTNSDTLTLTNPDGGSVGGALGVSSTVNSFTPNPPNHSTSTSWVVNGAGFATGASVTITESGTNLSTSSVVITSTKVTFKATTTSSRSSSSFVVTVRNPDGTVASRTQTMTPS